MEDDNGSDSALMETTERPFIVRFYGEEVACDDDGRTLDDILAFDDSRLEFYHDYIQILFPLPERSPFNPFAPVITKDTRDLFLENQDLRQRLFTAFARMADFYAFDVSGDENGPTLTPKLNFRKLAMRTWLTRVDHNHLRITRIIRCLRVLGLVATAEAFYQALQASADKISPKSLRFWRRAVERPLHLRPDEDDDARGVAWLRNDENEERAVRPPQPFSLQDLVQDESNDTRLDLGGIER